MPILDGYETAKPACKEGAIESASTPIIFLTAYGRDETETASAYASGAVDFIFTPVLADVLRAKVSAFIHLFVQSRELQRSLESITALNGALREGEARTRAVLQNVADGIVTADESRADRIVQPIRATALRLHRARGDRAAAQAHHRPQRGRRLRGTGDDRSGGGRRQDGSCFPMEISTSLVNVGARMLDHRRHPRHLRPQRAGRARARARARTAPRRPARPARLRGGADRRRHHRPRRGHPAGQPGHVRDDRLHGRRADRHAHSSRARPSRRAPAQRRRHRRAVERQAPTRSASRSATCTAAGGSSRRASR